ncbi:hypothetical protein D210916BOD24_07380 [Alteromonas sp. D210916BOD_24]
MFRKAIDLKVELVKMASLSFLFLAAKEGEQAKATDIATAALKSFFIIIIQSVPSLCVLLLYSITNKSLKIQYYSRPIT